MSTQRHLSPLTSACLPSSSGSLKGNHSSYVLSRSRSERRRVCSVAIPSLSYLHANAARCYRDGQFEQAVGIALESKRLDKVEEAVQKAPDTVGVLTYALRVCQSLVINREFRFQVCILSPSLLEAVCSTLLLSLVQIMRQNVHMSLLVSDDCCPGPAAPD